MMSTLVTIVHTLSHELGASLRRVWRAASRRERTLRIGIDVRPFYEPLTGVGWYLYHLLHEIAKRDDVELYLFGDARVTDFGPTLHAPVPERAHLCWFDLRGRGHVSGASRALTAAAYVVWMKLIGCDVVFGANYFLPRLLGAAARRRVVTVHDLTYKRFPALLQKETLANLEYHMKREIAHADAVICVSESTRNDLLAFYDADPSRIVAIPSGIAAPAGDSSPSSRLGMTQATGHPERSEESPAASRYILFVSTVEPRKNLDVLLDAFERLRARRAYDGSLVVVGKIGWKAEAIAKRLRAPGVVHLDYVSGARLGEVYANAELFVFPSIYEGFGFPLLEAMAYGVPSIAARSSSLPEVGGDAALYFEPDDSRSLEAQIERVLRDDALRTHLAAAGRARAAQFRWDVAAEKTLAVLRRAAE